jgi:chromatin segregation and condensation protein Rec8/ScpA/Scc1 (kleisin family)
MKEVGGRRAMHEVADDDTPIELHAADIEDRLRREGRLTLSGLLVGRASRGEMIGVFLALLELIRQKKVLVEQQADLSDITIQPAPAKLTTVDEPGESDQSSDSAGPTAPPVPPVGDAEVGTPAAPRLVEDGAQQP